MTSMQCETALIADAGFAKLDWAVVAAYLLLTTLIGAKLAGKQSTIRDFFLAGRRLPWWAICGSNIATEISAATFVVVPSMSFRAGGNLTFLQLAIGAIIARFVLAYWFIPKFYEHEIYSPYDFAERRLGKGVKKATTSLFLVAAVLGQGARVYITALVLGSIAKVDLIAAIWMIGLFAAAWTLIGGMSTVIWTDALQFLVLLGGAVVAAMYAVSDVPGGLAEVFSAARAADKLHVLNFNTSPAIAYTFWCGLLATPFLNLAAFGTDQVMAQRIFCCRNQRDAKLAVIVGNASLLVTVIMLFVGIAMYAHFLHVPMTPDETAQYFKNNETILPLFIARALPVGVRGVIVAAIFASAISTLTSTLAALSQTTLSAFVTSGRRGRGPGWFRSLGDVGRSRVLVLAWGVVLCFMATGCIQIARGYANAVDLALALVGYTYGPLLGIFLLALLPTGRDAAGLVWAVPLTMLAVFGMSQREILFDFAGQTYSLADWIVWAGCGTALLIGLLRCWTSLMRVSVIVGAVVAILWLHGFDAVPATPPSNAPAYTWAYPLGTLMTFLIGYTMGYPIGPGGKSKPAAALSRMGASSSSPSRNRSRRKARA